MFDYIFFTNCTLKDNEINSIKTLKKDLYFMSLNNSTVLLYSIGLVRHIYLGSIGTMDY